MVPYAGDMRARAESPLRAWSSDRFVLPLPPDHRFPMAKYRLLRERLIRSATLNESMLEVPLAIEDVDILRVHSEGYWTAVSSGQLDSRQQRAMGFPWSEAMVERSRRSVGATLAAAQWALAQSPTKGRLRCGVNLAGGTHHAFADRGEGFCVLNDVAIAVRALQARGLIDRALVIDCDVHQGNGTAALFEHDASCFTLSLHGERNYPLRKERSDLDVGLPDGCEDDLYLERLDEALAEVERRGVTQNSTELASVERGSVDPVSVDLVSVDLTVELADVVFYLAGADPFVGDRLGRLALTKAGLGERDRRVLSWCARRSLPTVVMMAGGYANEVEDIVDIHCGTIEIAVDLALGSASRSP